MSAKSVRPLTVEATAALWLEEKKLKAAEKCVAAKWHAEKEYDGAKRLLDLGFDHFIYMDHDVGGFFLVYTTYPSYDARLSDKDLAAGLKALKKFPYSFEFGGTKVMKKDKAPA
jgi:hypothetical protein